MDDLERSVFSDPKVRPDAAGLAAALGASAPLWETLREALAPVTEEWKCYGGKTGWQLKLLRGKRNLLFFTPLRGRFRLGFVFGDAAVAAVTESDLPPALKSELASARKYAEGRGIRLEVAGPDEAAWALTLARIKLAH